MFGVVLVSGHCQSQSQGVKSVCQTEVMHKDAVPGAPALGDLLDVGLFIVNRWQCLCSRICSTIWFHSYSAYIWLCPKFMGRHLTFEHCLFCDIPGCTIYFICIECSCIFAPLSSLYIIPEHPLLLLHTSRLQQHLPVASILPPTMMTPQELVTFSRTLNTIGAPLHIWISVVRYVVGSVAGN